MTTKKPGHPKVVGLLGGSFNPAHEGHLHISMAAIAQLDLDEVWWLVSPQNPLKPTEGMAPFEARFESATKAATAAKVIVKDVERKLGIQFSCDTIKALQKKHATTTFVWLMGSDNLETFHQWKNWAQIFEHIGIAVFPRGETPENALNSIAANAYKRNRVEDLEKFKYALKRPPAWVYLTMPQHPASATEIRGGKGCWWVRGSNSKRNSDNHT